MKSLFSVLIAATFGASINAMAFPNVVECRFEEKGRSCKTVITPCQLPQQPVGSLRCSVGFRVECSGRELHDGAFTSGWTISPLASACPDCPDMDLHDKGATIVIPEKEIGPSGSLRPAYPILKYDATDHISGFENSDARLYFESHGAPLRGTCSLGEFEPPVSPQS
jgi:hypothetical protein